VRGLGYFATPLEHVGHNFPEPTTICYAVDRIALAVDHSPYDTLYAAVAVALGGDKLIVAAGISPQPRGGIPTRHWHGLIMLLGDRGTANGVTAPHT
jgi:hypothetical protein